MKSSATSNPPKSRFWATASHTDSSDDEERKQPTTVPPGPRKGKQRKNDVEDLSPVVASLNGRGHLFAAMLYDVLTPEECDQLIQRSEGIGYEKALVNIGGGRQMAIEDYRNSDRCIIDDPKFADMLYQRILAKLEGHPHLLNPLLNWRMEGKQHAVGLNERLRILRYDPGCYFRPHSDGSYRRGMEAGSDRQGEKSEITILLYLNEEYQGGNTRFLHSRDRSSNYQVVPQTGSVLLFEHPCHQEGATLRAGRKYVVRTDLMYTKKGPGHEYSNGLYRETDPFTTPTKHRSQSKE